MKTVLVYCQSQNIADVSFSKTVQKLSDIYCQESPLSLLPCENDIQLMNIYKKYSKKHQIVITHELYNCLSINFNELLQGYRITEKYYDDNGDLSGYIAKRNHHTVIILPHDDKQIDNIICDAFCNEIFNPDLKFAHCTVSVTNLNQSEIKKRIEAEITCENQFITTVKNGNIVDIYIFSAAANNFEALELCKNKINDICDLFGENVFVDDLNSLAGNIVKSLSDKGLKVATAESCTAGMVSSAITSVPNSSGVFEIGISSYSNRIKNAALGVSKDILNEYGAVSAETAIAMAKGIKNLSGADIGVSVTGVAGPASSEGKPVGTVFAALVADRHKWVIQINLSDLQDRDAIRSKATYEVLELLRRYITCLPSVLSGGTEINSPYNLLYAQPSSENNGSIHLSAFADIPQTPDRGTFDFSLSPEVAENNNLLKSAINRRILIVKDFFCNAKYNIAGLFKRLNKKWASRITAAVLTLAIIFGCGYIFAFFKEKSDNDKLQAELQAAWNINISHDGIDNKPYFDKLHQISPHIMSWISIPGCVENPIGKNPENDYFEKRNILGKKSSYGAVHYDKNAIIGGENQTKNLIVYGKTASDESMFGSLKNYKSLSYLKEHSSVKIYQPDSYKVYHIFAVMIMTENVRESGDNFNYFNTDITAQTQFSDYIAGVKERSIYSTVAAIANDSDILTLVTDSDDFDGAKLLVVAFSNEKLAFENNYSSTLSVNPIPKYPKIWYDEHGTKDPFKRELDMQQSNESKTSSDVTSNTNSEISTTEVTSADNTSTATSSKESSVSHTNTSSKKNTSTTSRVTSSKTTSSRRQNSEAPVSKPVSKPESNIDSSTPSDSSAPVSNPENESSTESQTVVE